MDNIQFQSGPEPLSGTIESTNVTFGGAIANPKAKSKVMKRATSSATDLVSSEAMSAGTSRANMPLEDQMTKRWQEQMQRSGTPSSPNPPAGRLMGPRTSSRGYPHAERPQTAIISSHSPGRVSVDDSTLLPLIHGRYHQSASDAAAERTHALEVSENQLERQWQQQQEEGESNVTDRARDDHGPLHHGQQVPSEVEDESDKTGVAGPWVPQESPVTKPSRSIFHPTYRSSGPAAASLPRTTGPTTPLTGAQQPSSSRGAGQQVPYNMVVTWKAADPSHREAKTPTSAGGQNPGARMAAESMNDLRNPQRSDPGPQPKMSDRREPIPIPTSNVHRDGSCEQSAIHVPTTGKLYGPRAGLRPLPKHALSQQSTSPLTNMRRPAPQHSLSSNPTCANILRTAGDPYSQPSPATQNINRFGNEVDDADNIYTPRAPHRQPSTASSPGSAGVPHKSDLDTFPAVMEALARFDTDISPWDSPHEWNSAYDSHIRSICQALTRITGKDELPGAYIGSHMIYPGLIVYLFIQLTACEANGKTAFRDTLEKWRTWDDIIVFEQHQQVKDYLVGMISELKRMDSALHTRETFEILLALDVVNFSAQLTMLVMNNDCYKGLIKRHEEAAQALVNILQARLDYPIEPPFKSRHRKALVKLSERSQRYSECLLLEDITISPDPVQGGSFGEVFKGDMAGCAIAVKVLKVYQKSKMDKILKSFSREAVIWRQLSHPNVLPFYGIFANSPKLCLVSPWMQNGNLSDFLSEIAPEIDCVPLALDVAKGLEYLHSQNVLHADLKCGNVLVSDARRACLADFGLSVAQDTNSVLATASSTRGAGGTPAWTAPELLLDETKRPDKACDVYSFSMVCYEMFSGCIPFRGKSGQVIVAMSKGRRPERPVDPRSHRRGLTDDIWDIIETCWHQQPEARLAAGHAVQRLSTLPGRPADNRPEGHFSIPPPSRAVSRHAQHPFSILQIIRERDSTGIPFIPGSISQIFGLPDSWDSIRVVAEGPVPEQVYDRLEDFFPEHDLDSLVIEAGSGAGSPTTPEHLAPPAPLFRDYSSQPNRPSANMSRLNPHSLANNKAGHRGSTFTDNEETWAPRPAPEEVYDRLEDFFPEHDLDKTDIEAGSGAKGIGRKTKKSIRIVAEEHKKRIDRTSRADNIASVLRKISTKLWGSRMEEVTTEQAKAEQARALYTASSPESPSGGSRPIFKWIRGELIGQGTYGRVYLALNATTGEMIAVKQVEIPQTASDKADTRKTVFVKALKSESETLKDLDHPNVVQYLGFEETPNFLSIFLEYVPGGSIGGCLLKHGKFEEEVTKSFTEQILTGLEYLHSKNIIHRDLKADNILVETSGVCRITDFGISKRTDDINGIGASTAMQGTVFWMAPEVIDTPGRGYDNKIDIWSVGCVVLEMWTGKRPWSGDEAIAVILKLYKSKLPPPVPDDVTLTPLAHNFRNLCFAINPDERPTAARLRQHPYLALPPGWYFTGFEPGV